MGLKFCISTKLQGNASAAGVGHHIFSGKARDYPLHVKKYFLLILF